MWGEGDIERGLNEQARIRNQEIEWTMFTIIVTNTHHLNTQSIVKVSLLLVLAKPVGKTILQANTNAEAEGR